MQNNFYKNDISEIISGISDCKKKLRNQRILLVGANGFLGNIVLIKIILHINLK